MHTRLAGSNWLACLVSSWSLVADAGGCTWNGVTRNTGELAACEALESTCDAVVLTKHVLVDVEASVSWRDA